MATRSDPESVPAPNVGESVTISIAEIRKARAALGRSRGPMVLAVHCPDGHPNPPGAPTCRTCAATIVDSDAVKIPRPALGVLEFTDGSVQVLDRPLILGRKPTLDRSIRGEPVRAVVLDDSTRALSRVQAEICFRGWQVQVIDHASVNPTCIEPPGGPIVRLPPGEPVTIEPGSRILFAEVIECRFLEKPE